MDHYNEIKKEDCEYGRYFNSLEQCGYCPDADEEELKKNTEYKYFLENLKLDENGVSYSVELPVTSAISIVLKYDGSEEEYFENVDRQTNFKSNSERQKAKVPGNLGGFPVKARADNPKTVTKSLVTGDYGYGSKKRSTAVPGQKRKGDDMNGLGEETEANPIPCKSSRGSSKSMICVVKDESQDMFSFDESGMNTELGHEKGHTNTPHKNDKSCFEVEILDNIPLLDGGYTPFVSSKSHQLMAAEDFRDDIRGSSPFQFREKLMGLLKVPYNRQEFDDLWLKVTTKRKPAQGVKESHRRKMRSYSTKPEGKSYLDWHEELSIKVEEYRHDRHKVLYLLRGFFFWLENTAHEGAFQPWLDSLFLKGF